jgi:hypothetical protein
VNLSNNSSFLSAIVHTPNSKTNFRRVLKESLTSENNSTVMQEVEKYEDEEENFNNF